MENCLMLNVVTPNEADKIISVEIEKLRAVETVGLWDAVGRVSARDVRSKENLPSFSRSVVDGFAVRACDTYGCSETIPAMLRLCGEIEMGENTERSVCGGECIRIPTGGKLPENADSVIMLEFCEEIGDGYVLAQKSVSVFENVNRLGDDCKVGEIIIEKGSVITARSIAVLAAVGIDRLEVYKRPVVGIISTGDELISHSGVPVGSQIRDINSVMLYSAVKALGCFVSVFPVCPDDEAMLLQSVSDALSKCNVLLISGGSSAGEKDNVFRVLSSIGKVLFHGIAIKPGKPTMFAVCGNKAVFGLPGHPGAAYFMFELLVKPALLKAENRRLGDKKAPAVLSQNVSSNNGRATVCAVKLEGKKASAVFAKSGAVAKLSKADGYFIIDRDTEGYPAGREIEVTLFET